MCCLHGRTFVSSCKCCMLVSAVLPVAMRSAVFCMVCILFVCLSEMMGPQMEQAYSRMGRVIALYVLMIVSFCFPHVVDVSALSILIVLRAFVVVSV